MSDRMTWGVRSARWSRPVAVLTLAGALLAAGSGEAAGSGGAGGDQKVAEQPCTEGWVGHLGIVGLDCRGCPLTFKKGDTGWERFWSFGTEPRITEIAPGSPAEGMLRVGDEIVGIDGMLITSAEGGRRFSNLVPDGSVTIRYRRRGRTADAVIRTTRRCGQYVEGMKTNPVKWASAEGLLELAGGFRIQANDAGQRNVTIDLPDGLSIIGSGRSGTTVRRDMAVGDGRLGLRWSCESSCSGTKSPDGTRVWRFSGLVSVSGIDGGGPADLAGIRVGDRIVAVNGHRIDSRRGGEEFSLVRPGQAMRLTLRGPAGRERTVSVVPVVPVARRPEDTPRQQPR